MEIHHVSVEILDINDNSPTFQEEEFIFEIPESTLPGRRFQLPIAHDPDVVTNAVRVYKLNTNEYFSTEIRERADDKVPFLVLQKSLDREKYTEHRLILSAVDGGNPPKSGSLNITLKVLDSNDNHPTFTQDVYSVTLSENVNPDKSIIQVEATDLDDGLNGEIEYYFGGQLDSKIYEMFSLDKNTGEISVKGQIDFEKADVYKLDIRATDKGQPPMSTDCRVIIKIVDENDNQPEIDVTSLSKTVAEDSKPGTVIALISITDKDVGLNGKVICRLSKNVPFELKPSFQDNMYSLVLKDRLDRELVADYDITITATDCGQPPLSTFKILHVDVSDVNDNIPTFTQSPIELYLLENNVPGKSIFSVTAFDKDLNENAALTYQINREGRQGKMSTFLNINPENGEISALKCFDFETLKSFQFQVVATDGGSPPLSSNVTVKVFILDQNDNAPVILYPVSSNGSAEGVEEIPRNLKAGDLVTKVRAYDADIGYNGWLLFSLQQVSDHSLFSLDRYTGQIRTLRSFTETDEAEHRLLILVKDNGNVSLSATATVTVKLVEPKEAFAASDVKSAAKEDEEDNVTFYLIITLGSVSLLFVISIIVLIAMQCSKSTEYTSKYLQDANYDGTLCHSIQYRSGEKRYMLVGPRMSIGSTEIPRNLKAGDLVTKVRAYDADIGYNGWLLFSLQQVSDHSLFSLDRYTGQIRTLRSFTETDEAEHRLLILVKDNGNVSLSASATVTIKLVEPKEAFAASDVKSATKEDEEDNVTFYLIVTLGSVSLLFVISIIVLIAMQCSKSTEYTSKYLQDANYIMTPRCVTASSTDQETSATCSWDPE
uniref:Si:ch73-379j16.2 n=1 Tax=Hippocampus comes TaxID=109280 RepID=A0A3Q2YE33_HIPCM